LKRKLAINVYIKVVALITSFHMSGQPSLNSIPMRNYGQNTKTMSNIQWFYSNLIFRLRKQLFFNLIFYVYCRFSLALPRSTDCRVSGARVNREKIIYIVQIKIFS